MTQVCRVCSHPDRKAIDRQILSGGNLSEIAKANNVSYNSIWRHKQNGHIGGAALAGVRKSDQNQGVRLLEDLDDLIVTARRILREAEADGHRKTALAAVKEVRSSVLAIASISHAIWTQQNQEAQTIVVQQQEEDQSRWFTEGWPSLTKEEQTEYRRLCIKMLSNSGGHITNEADLEEPDLGNSGELRVDQTDFSLKPTRRSTPRKPDQDPGTGGMKRSTPRQ